MEVTGFPTSCDIYLELDGKKVAVVQSYTAKATKTSQVVEAFGESEPVATINGQNKYVLELTRLYATDEAISDGIDFFKLEMCIRDRGGGHDAPRKEDDHAMDDMRYFAATIVEPEQRSTSFFAGSVERPIW